MDKIFIIKTFKASLGKSRIVVCICVKYSCDVRIILYYVRVYNFGNFVNGREWENMIKENTFIPGLEGVVAAETAISLLDTEHGQIIIKGHDLIKLSKGNDYLDVVHLLFEGNLPTEAEKKEIEKRLMKSYEIPKGVETVLRALPPTTHPMDTLRTGISALGGFDPLLEEREHEINKKRAYDILGKIPSIVANGYRVIEGQETIQPRADLSFSANFLYMITGKEPTKLEERFLINRYYYTANMKCLTQHLLRESLHPHNQICTGH